MKMDDGTWSDETEWGIHNLKDMKCSINHERQIL